MPLKPDQQVAKCQNPKCMPGDGDDACMVCRRCRLNLCDLCADEHHRHTDCVARDLLWMHSRGAAAFSSQKE